jgi:hypothetical protein
MIKVYTGLKGFAVTLFILAGVVLLFSILFWGITKAIELLLPLLIILSYLLIFVFVFGVLPATFVKDLRPSLSVYSVLMSHALGVMTWMMSFFYVVNAFGFWGICLTFLFQYLAPIALIAAIIRSSWHIVVHLSLWISFIYGMRFYSQWLLSFERPPGRGKGDIIDVDAIEV